MRGLGWLWVASSMLLVSLTVLCLAQDMKLYPGAKHDDQVSRDATAAAPGKQVDVYLTTDDFDKVYAFYKALYKEQTMAGARQPQKQTTKMAFFLIDGAANMASSKYWAKVQHPYLDPAGKNQDLTVIQTFRSK